MVTINGKLVAAFATVIFLTACGGKTVKEDNTPPPLVSNNFEGFYIVDQRFDNAMGEPDSALFFAIKKTGAEYQIIRYTQLFAANRLINRGPVNAAFKNESDHRIIANGGYASVSYTPQDTLWRYVNKPDDFRLIRICDFTAKDTSAASVEKMLDENGALGR